MTKMKKKDKVMIVSLITQEAMKRIKKTMRQKVQMCTQAAMTLKVWTGTKWKGKQFRRRRNNWFKI